MKNFVSVVVVHPLFALMCTITSKLIGWFWVDTSLNDFLLSIGAGSRSRRRCRSVLMTVWIEPVAVDRSSPTGTRTFAHNQFEERAPLGFVVVRRFLMLGRLTDETVDGGNSRAMPAKFFCFALFFLMLLLWGISSFSKSSSSNNTLVPEHQNVSYSVFLDWKLLLPQVSSLSQVY